MSMPNQADFEARMLVLGSNIEVVMKYLQKMMGQQTDLDALVQRVSNGDMNAFMDMMGLITRMEPAFETIARAIRQLENDAR